MCFGLVFRSPKTPIELAIDFILHDFEMAGEFLRNTHDNNVADWLVDWFFILLISEVEPISTYVDFGEREFLVADERGYECLLYKMAEEFLVTSHGNILDYRLKLNQV